MIALAITQLHPNSVWRLSDEPKNANEYAKFLEWGSDVPAPTWDEIQASVKKIFTVYAATQYRRDRAAAYPPIGDQLDALFHAGIFPAEMAAKLAEVKARFPK